jgi:peptide/nickel transport system substrate-binding protein
MSFNVETGGCATRRGRLLWILGPVLALITALVIAASSAAPASAASSKTLTVGIVEGPLSLNPQVGGAGPYSPMYGLAYSTLIDIAPSGSYVPGLAKSWKYVGSGNKTFELTLRQNAKFSDGTPVTASDVKTWLQYASKSALVGSLISIKSISTIGQSTVEIHLAQPNPELPQIFTANWGMIASPKGIANPKLLAGGQEGGAGPYELVPSQSVANSKYTYVPNKYYFDKSQIHYSKIVVQIITSASSLLEAVKSGQIDAAYGSTETAAAAQSGGLKVYSAASGVNLLVITDRGGKAVKALGNPKVRQALNYAINRKVITEAVAGKYGTPTSDPEIGPGATPALNNYYTYNPKKAKQLLASSGYSEGFTFHVVSWVDPSVGSTVLLAAAKYLAAVGVTMDVYQPPTGIDYVTAVKQFGTYTAQQVLTNNGGTGASAIEDYDNLLAPDSGIATNIYHATDPTLAALYGQALSAANPVPVEQSMVKRIVSQAYTLPIYRYDYLWYASSKIGGIQITSSVPQPDIADWYTK